MDITNTCCKHVHAQISDHLAFLRIRTFTCTDHAVFFTTNGTNLCFQRHSFFTADFYKFFCLFNIFFDRIFGAVEHDGRKSCFHAFQTSFVGSVIQMDRYRNRNSQFFNHSSSHCCNCLKSGHVLSSALRNTKDNRRFCFFCCQQNFFCPFQVINIKLANSIVTGYGLF